jgi:hypothetical protein
MTRLQQASFFVFLVLLMNPPPASSYQGVASPGPLVRPVAPIKTNLPPITVNFRDIAEQAGLTAENVSGGADKKDYILETTGDGVDIFD